jgi:hypothetical protein
LKRVGVVVSAALASLLMACSDQGPASLEFVDITPAQPRIGDIVTVKFRAIDSRGLPAEGLPVTFALQSPSAGVTLSPLEGQTNKSTGEVTTQVIASNRVSSLVIIASSGDKVTQSNPFNVAGSDGSDRGITFQCGETNGNASGGIHAIMAYGPGRDLIAGVKVKCIAHVSDRNGDGIPNAQVSFLTEAGSIGPTAETVTDVIGNAEVLYKTSYPLPQDVEPGRFIHNPPVDLTHIEQPLAPAWMHPWEWRSNPIGEPAGDPACPGGCAEPRRPDPVRPGRINNPRDNLVAMIAVTSGEESFIDVDNNGRWDEGEPFEDTVEPFVDANDNGTWDSGELYIDTNGDGVWSPKNGTFETSTLIWAQERILWTGMPNIYDYANNLPLNPPPGHIPTIGQFQPSGGIDILHHGSRSVSFKLTDPWFNLFAQTADSDGCKATSSNAVVVLPGAFGDTGVRFRYPPVVEVGFVIRDSHGPQTAPENSTYEVWVNCEVTASPEEGARYSIGIGTVTGSVN